MSRRSIAEVAAASTNLARMWTSADLTLAAKRVSEWAAGVKAAAYDPDRTSAPNRVADINGQRFVVPNISDPTGETAIYRRPDVPDYGAIIAAYLNAARELERVTPELTRSTDPSLFDLEATDTADRVRPGAGVCEACGRECTGLRVEGQAEDRIKHVDGHPLCPTHYAGTRTNRYGDIASYIASVRATRGLDL